MTIEAQGQWLAPPSISRKGEPMPSQAFSTILVAEPRAHVLQITLHRPEVRNALSTQMLAEIVAALAGAQAEPTVRVVLLAGGQKAFAAGADVHELAAHTPQTIRSDARVRHWAAIRAFPKPLIAAVSGYALGGGAELAMHADIVIASETAVFGQPEINLGVIPGAGGTQRLVRAVGKSLAMKMILTGQAIAASEALARGLVAEVTSVDALLERALEIAGLIAARPPLAVRAAKAAVLQSYELPLAQGLAAERRAFEQLFATADKVEGVAAFLEKRAPQFRGE
jgi:enoyl-CoA hydratase